MAKEKTINIDLSDKGFIKISHEGEAPVGNRYITKDNACLVFSEKYDEGEVIPCVSIGKVRYPLDIVKTPVTWLPTTAGLNVAVSDLEAWMSEN